jgi:ABC-type Fe3+ transport system substrate-binding protein
MAQKKGKITVLLLTLALGFFVFSAPGFANPPGFGKSFEEVVKLAIKEGKVRIGMGFSDEKSMERVMAGFFKKYPHIKVEYSTVNSNNREKIFAELLAGQVDYDVVDVSLEVHNKWRKANLLVGPFEWRTLFPNLPKQHLSPDGYFAAGAVSFDGVAYHPGLVPDERVPRKWEDCVDPYWKGKFILDTRPNNIVGLYPAWGEVKLLDYAKKLKENQPLWKRGMNDSVTFVSSGEALMICGISYSPVQRALDKDPKANIRAVLLNEVPAGVNKTMGIVKGTKNPNAALLLAGWLASPEGTKGYDEVGYGSPFIEGTNASKLIQKSGSKVIFGGWDEADYRPGITEKITAVWGFRAKK